MSDTFWKTSLSAVEENKILIRGYRVQDLMEHCNFGDVVYLTFKGDLPKGRELSFAGSPDGVAGAITGFNFDDVAKADQVDFSKASQSVTNTFDGLTITVKIAAKGMDHWATVAATGTSPMTQEEAARINARANGWAFKLMDMGVTQFTATLETLLKPLPGK